MPEPTHAPSVSGSDSTLAADDPSVASAPHEPATARPFHAGLELGGRYRLVAPLGKGGMGEVWEAVHTVLGRTVAIKLVLGEAADPQLAQRLQREAELVARLEHSNIVSVIDFGEAGPGQPFVVMERLSGRTLSSLLRERGTLPWTQAREIAVQIAAGLVCAHAAGVIHRDLKPSNVFVLDDPHGHLPIKIIDFGLAKATTLGPGDRALTRTGSVFGTPAYMAPEQAKGEPVDGRVDLYALGAIIYEMIVGERLWQRGSAVGLLYCQLFEPAPTIRARFPQLPAELDVLVARCLCKDRAMRPTDADAMRVELVGVGSGKGATVVPHELLPVPAPELRARYASELSLARVMPSATTPDATASAAPRRWLVPTILAGVVASMGLAAVQLVPRFGLGATVEAPPPNDGMPTRDPSPSVATPSDAEPSAAAPSVVPPSVVPPSVATPSVAPAAVAAPLVPPIPASAAASSTAKPAAETTSNKTHARPRARTAATTPAAKPEPSEPAVQEPVTRPPVPRRKGDVLDWPTP